MREKIKSLIKFIKYHWLICIFLSFAPITGISFLLGVFNGQDFFDLVRDPDFFSILLVTFLISLIFFFMLAFAFEPTKRFIIYNLTKYFPFSLLFRGNFYHKKNITVYYSYRILYDVFDTLNISIRLKKIEYDKKFVIFFFKADPMTNSKLANVEAELQKKDASVYLRKADNETYYFITINKISP